MIIGKDKIKFDLSKRFFELYKGNLDFLDNKIKMDKELVSLELVDLDIEESEKQEIMYQFQVSIDGKLIDMKNKNSQIDKEISQLVINLHQDLLANVRTTK